MALYSAGTSVLNAGALVGAGKIIQIVRAHSTSTTTTSSSSYTHFSSIDLSITPTSASNKILVFFSSNLDNNAAGRQGQVSCWREVGGANNIVLQSPMAQPAYSVSSTRVTDAFSWIYHDNPASTSACRYRPVVKSATGNQVGMGGFSTSLFLMEADI